MCVVEGGSHGSELEREMCVVEGGSRGSDLEREMCVVEGGSRGSHGSELERCVWWRVAHVALSWRERCV